MVTLAELVTVPVPLGAVRVRVPVYVPEVAAVTFVVMFIGLVTKAEAGLKVSPLPLKVKVAWVPVCRLTMVLLPPLRAVGVAAGMVMAAGRTADRVGATWTFCLKET
jgi:hypothetical protein